MAKVLIVGAGAAGLMAAGAAVRQGHQVTVLEHTDKPGQKILVTGKELPHFLHRRKFEEAESGWYYSQRLKSVQVKYPNPKKDHEVMVSFEQFDLIGM